MHVKTAAAIATLLASTATFAAVSKDIPEGVVESTDPAKIAEVERHAQELQAQQQRSMKLSTSGTGSTKSTTKHHRKSKKAAPAKSST